MSVFDLFGKNERKNNKPNSSTELFRDNNQTSSNIGGPVSVFNPDSLDCVADIIDTLRLGKSAVVHLNALKPDTALRIMDYLSGAVYSLGGGVYEMEKNIYMFSPSGVELH
ncbi:MAG: cell division protein SepF [Clostridia bacterium]|nr:cell division protein SepF [Clostridia bacterium]